MKRALRAQRGGGRADPLRVGVVVAHPDDETLWAGGAILSHPGWDTFVAALCRGSDPDRAPRFRRALERLGAAGAMADLDDGPEQIPLAADEVEAAILSLLPEGDYDVVLTHGPCGEYTRHRRHEETSRAVMRLWRASRLSTRRLWLFAYDDDGGAHLPLARRDAHRTNELARATWRRKYDIITQTYGFAAESFEARAAPRVEAFWCFESAPALAAWLTERGIEDDEGTGAV